MTNETTEFGNPPGKDEDNPRGDDVARRLVEGAQQQVGAGEISG